jgi:RNA polymerase sigma-70 factor (ECF subfamily)
MGAKMRPPEPNDDRGLVAKAKEGHMDAFEELVRRHQRSIYALCHRLTGAHQTADDLSQEAFIKAYFNLSHFVDGMDFYPWIRRIALNGCLNHLKKGKRERPLREEGQSTRPDVFGSPAELPQDTIERTEIECKFQEVFSALPPDQKMIFTLRVNENQSYRDIARALNIPEGTVMSRLNRARSRLKESMAGFLRRDR